MAWRLAMLIDQSPLGETLPLNLAGQASLFGKKFQDPVFDQRRSLTERYKILRAASQDHMRWCLGPLLRPSCVLGPAPGRPEGRYPVLADERRHSRRLDLSLFVQGKQPEPKSPRTPVISVLAGSVEPQENRTKPRHHRGKQCLLAAAK